MKLWAPSLENQQRLNSSCLKYFTRNVITCISLWTAYAPLSAILLTLMYYHLVRIQPMYFYSGIREISGLMCGYQIVKVMQARHSVWHLSLKISIYQLSVEAVNLDKNCFALRLKRQMHRTSDRQYGLRLYSPVALDSTGYIFRITSHLLEWL